MSVEWLGLKLCYCPIIVFQEMGLFGTWDNSLFDWYHCMAWFLCSWLYTQATKFHLEYNYWCCLFLPALLYNFAFVQGEIWSGGEFIGTEVFALFIKNKIFG